MTKVNQNLNSAKQATVFSSEEKTCRKGFPDPDRQKKNFFEKDKNHISGAKYKKFPMSQ